MCVRPFIWPPSETDERFEPASETRAVPATLELLTAIERHLARHHVVDGAAGDRHQLVVLAVRPQAVEHDDPAIQGRPAGTVRFAV